MYTFLFPCLNSQVRVKISQNYFCLTKMYGKSCTKIWMLKGGYRGSPPSPAPASPPLRSRFLYRIVYINLPKKCMVAFQRPDFLVADDDQQKNITEATYDKNCIVRYQSLDISYFLSKSRTLDISSWLYIYIYIAFHAGSESAVRIDQLLHPEEKFKKNQPMRVSISYRKMYHYMSPPYINIILIY